MQAAGTYDDLVTLLSQGLAQRAMYFETHPRVQQRAREFCARLAALLAADHREFFFLGFVEGRLVHDGQFLIGPTILGRRIVDLLAALDCGGILFKAGTAEAELLALLQVAAEQRKRALDLAGARALLQQQGAARIQLSPPYSDPGWFGLFLFEGDEPLGRQPLAGDDLGRLVPVYQRMFDAVEQAHARAGRADTLDVDSVRGVGEQLLAAADGSFTDVMQLVRYPDYDTFTVGHSVRVASIAALVGHSIGLPRPAQIELLTAGMLHDVGKSQIPDAVLYKSDGLDDEERRLVERHPVFGAQILLENREASRMAIAAAWGHHLRHSGGGYPTMPDWGVTSRMTALLKACDVFEALTAVRPYKSAMSAHRAFELMLADEGSFAPGALRALIAALGLYPPGTHVLLSSGQQGVVERAGQRIHQPLVRVTHNRDGRPLDETRQCDLATLAGTLRVVRTLPDARARPREAGEGAAPAVCSHPHADAEHAALGRRIGRRD